MVIHFKLMFRMSFHKVWFERAGLSKSSTAECTTKRFFPSMNHHMPFKSGRLCKTLETFRTNEFLLCCPRLHLKLDWKTKINLQNHELAPCVWSFWLFLEIFGNTLDTQRVFLRCVLNSVASNYSFVWKLYCSIHTRTASLRCEFARDAEDRTGHRSLWSTFGRCVGRVAPKALKDLQVDLIQVPFPRKPWKFEN